MVFAMFILPHSAFLLGRWTSFRTGVPLTPRGGEMMAWALVCRERLKNIRAEATILLEYMFGGVNEQESVE